MSHRIIQRNKRSIGLKQIPASAQANAALENSTETQSKAGDGQIAKCSQPARQRDSSEQAKIFISNVNINLNNVFINMKNVANVS